MFGLTAKKNTAMERGYQSYNILKNYILSNMKEESSLSNDEYTPCYTPKEMLDLLYNSRQYEDFVTDSLVFKKICNKIIIIQLAIIIIMTVTLIGIFALFNLTSIGIVLALVLDVIFLVTSSKNRKTYQQYYDETMANILNMAVSEYTIINQNKNLVISNIFINKHLNVKYNDFSTIYNYKFESKYEIGDDFELELKNNVQTKDNDGNTVTKEDTVFDGFSIVSQNKQPHHVLNGSIIKIRDDNNITSALFEDTMNSIVKSKRDFSFNSEKLNKHLDCTLTRTGFTSDVDQKMFEVTKIITPAFEEKLLFLDERYNSFNMNISDTEFSFTVNMKKDGFQKIQNGEMFKFSTDYKNRKCNTNIFYDANFEYDKLYPILERLFLHKYFRVIYNYQMDSTRFNNYDNEKITQYENEIKDIMDIPWKEFSQTNEDYVKNLKEQINEKYNAL